MQEATCPCRELSAWWFSGVSRCAHVISSEAVVCRGQQTPQTCGPAGRRTSSASRSSAWRLRTAGASTLNPRPEAQTPPAPSRASCRLVLGRVPRWRAGQLRSVPKTGCAQASAGWALHSSSRADCMWQLQRTKYLISGWPGGQAASQPPNVGLACSSGSIIPHSDAQNQHTQRTQYRMHMQGRHCRRRGHGHAGRGTRQGPGRHCEACDALRPVPALQVRPLLSSSTSACHTRLANP